MKGTDPTSPACDTDFDSTVDDHRGWLEEAGFDCERAIRLAEPHTASATNK